MQVLYVQPYVPGYRVPLFDELASQLESRGDSLTVASGQASGPQALRQDAGAGRWHIEVEARTLATPLGQFKHRRGLGTIVRQSDICVMELDVGNVNAWSTLVSRRRPPLVLWGHGKAYTTQARWLREQLKIQQAKLADHVMTYTSSGRAHLIAGGVDRDQVSAVGNSTDTEALRRAFADRLTRSRDISEAFQLDVAGRLVAMYVGGLDTDKRIPFLLEAAAHAQTKDPRFLLLVAGSGSDQSLVETATRTGHVAWLPRADRTALADMAAVSKAVWMPGRVGLVGVDALALGRAVLTTDYPYHAPEFELLQPGFDVYLLTDEPKTFAVEALELMIANDVASREMPWTAPSINEVATRMIAVLDRIAR